MDDTTLSEVINVSKHSTGSPIGNTQRNVNSGAVCKRRKNGTEREKV